MNHFTFTTTDLFLAFTIAGALVIVTASFIRREDKYPAFCVAVGSLVLCVLTSIPLYLTTVFHPHTMDAALYRADLALGLNPLPVYHFVMSIPWLKWLVFIIYFSIYVPFAIAYVVERSPVLINVMVAAPIGAFVFYNLVPAVGPSHALLGSFDASAARNCFPSMHLGWALLLAWNVERPWLKIGAWIFVTLTAFATIGIGEHYFVDLIVTVPFCWGVQKLVSVRMAVRTGAKLSVGTGSV
jgi:hypothetical protein